MPTRYIQPAEPVYQVQPPRPDVVGVGGDVARDHVGLDLVALGVDPRARVVHRIQHVEELDRFVAAAQAGEGHHHPEGRVGVLPAVLAHPGRVGRDVAGIGLRRR